MATRQTRTQQATGDASSDSPLLHLRVELEEGLYALTAAAGSSALAARIRGDLTDLLQQLGVPGRPEVIVAPIRGSSRRAVRIWVNESLQPYSLELMWSVWHASHGLPLPTPANESGSPDQWLIGYSRAALEGATTEDLVNAGRWWGDYLARVVMWAIRAQPRRLVGVPQAEAYWTAAASPVSDGLPRLGPFRAQALVRVLGDLLELGVTVVDTQVIGMAVAQELAVSRTVEDIVEALFARYRVLDVEVHAHPTYLEMLVPLARQRLEPGASRADDRQQLFDLLGEGLFEELGLVPPRVILRDDPSVPEGMIAVKINDCLMPPVQGLQSGEVLVAAGVEQLRALNVAARSAAHLGKGPDCAIVAEQERAASLTANQFATWTATDYLALTISGLIRGAADRLLSVEDVEFELARLRRAAPALVSATLECFSTPELTRVLRGLLREQVSIRDLRTILERLLHFDTVPVDGRTWVVFDNRLAVPENTPPANVNHWRNQVEFVRGGLKYYLSHKYAPYRNSLIVYLVDAGVEAEAIALADEMRAATNRDGADERREVVRDAFWNQVGATHAAGSHVLLLTTSDGRAALRELLAPEMPEVHVLAYSELRQNLSIMPLGKLTLPGGFAMSTVADDAQATRTAS